MKLYRDILTQRFIFENLIAIFALRMHRQKISTKAGKENLVYAYT